MTLLWWVIWFPLSIGSFGLIERYALKHPDRQWTLSRTIATIGAKWPLSIGLWGMFFGGLMVHFFWHFCPPGSITSGMLLLLPLFHG